MSIIFFRNDDVRNSLDQSLIDLTNIFIRNNIPITHAVEPANLTPRVINWLLEVKQSHPTIIGIMQHGYDHGVKNEYQKGEFGGQRTYEEQFEDLRKGMELMDKYFGCNWFKAINFPYAPYNLETIKAANDCGYKVLNSHFNRGLSRRIFYFIGHLLRKGILFNHHVSWNMKKYPGTKMYEISMGISFIKRYINECTECEFYSFEEIRTKIDQYVKSPYPIGLLLHHRYHVSSQSMELINKVLDYLIHIELVPVSMESIYLELERRSGLK